jgi:hypothetical protein
MVKALSTKWIIDDESKDCVTMFLYRGDVRDLVISVIDLETNDFYTPFIESQPEDYNTEVIIDAEVYPENGVDYIYFTDFYNEIRYIKCSDPGTSVSSYDISLQRKGANGLIALTSIASTGGTLLSGTYQFAYRMCDPVNKKFTRWSTLTNPVHIYSASNSSSPVYSGIGLSTTRKINLTITPSTAETDNFDYIQLAVVENVGPTISDIDGVTSALPDKASLLEITAIPSTSLAFAYKSNSRIGTIPISDITVDLAQIKTAKTLAIKENRLIGAYVIYTDLTNDNGIPACATGSIIAQTVSTQDAYSSDDFASRYVGYWRDELYRFGIVYYDADGNRSPVFVLNMTGKITGNQSSGYDVKFPSRSTSSTYAILNSANRVQALGLQLNNLTGHPTWAVSFEIVRVKRIKDILFQSPIIPMTQVNGVGSVDNYPTIYTAAGGDVTLTDAQPQTAGSVLVPKNLFRPETRKIVRRTAPGGVNNLRVRPGEATYEASGTYQYSQLFPSPSMYEDTPFVFTGSEKVDFVDYALLKAQVDDETTGSYINGDTLYTNISANFHALNEGSYFFDGTWVAKSISATYKNIPLVDYEFFNNFGEPASVTGASVMDYNALQTTGVDWGYKPNVLKGAVVKLGGNALSEINQTQKVFKNATLNAYSAGAYVTSQNTVAYESSLSNNFINEYSGYTANASYVNAVGIVNVKLGLGDDRYGDLTSFHEFISTGTKYNFSDSEITTLQGGGSVTIASVTVWGGDCFVGPHTYKVSDSTYSITNNGKNIGSPETEDTLIDKWRLTYQVTTGGTFGIGANDAFLCIPVAVENASQYVTVILESDYSEVRDIDSVASQGSENGMPIFNNASKESYRTPLTYKYNLNLSKQNDRKIYVPKPTYSFSQDQFGGRVVYSDLKIYNSDQAGFDIFRVGNVYDLEENRRNITKLAVAGDNLYAIQEQGVVYLPTGNRQIEATDAGQLAVRSGDVIGRPIIIDAIRGCQHLKSVISTGNVIYFPDNKNKSVYVLAGQELKPIVKDNETQFRDFLGNSLAEASVVGLYDPIRKEYWLIDNENDRCEVFNENIGWIGEYDFTGLQGGVSANQKLYVFGSLENDSSLIYSMYTGAVNQLFGITTTPRVSFIVNPDGNSSKTFDNIIIASSEALATIDYVTENGGSSQTVTGTSVDITPREGSYQTYIPRDESNGRLRGLRMKVTLKWKATQSALNAFYTKFRQSARRF